MVCFQLSKYHGLWTRARGAYWSDWWIFRIQRVYTRWDEVWMHAYVCVPIGSWSFSGICNIRYWSIYKPDREREKERERERDDMSDDFTPWWHLKNWINTLNRCLNWSTASERLSQIPPVELIPSVPTAWPAGAGDRGVCIVINELKHIWHTRIVPTFPSAICTVKFL